MLSNTTQLSAAASGNVEGSTVKIEPKRMSCVAPVEALLVADR